MGIIKWFSKSRAANPTDSPKRYSESELLQLKMDAYRIYNWDTYLEWVNNETDALRLACAYCLINCWDWPNYMPSEPNYTENERYDYGSPAFHFSQEIMNLCKSKAETIFPGLTQSVWLSNIYNKYSTRRETLNPQTP